MGKEETQGAVGGGGRQETRRGWPELPDRERIWVDKKQLVTFIVAAINSTAESKSKTTSTQYIVRAAVDHLGMVGLKWEEVDAEIKQQSSQDTGKCTG